MMKGEGDRPSAAAAWVNETAPANKHHELKNRIVGRGLKAPPLMMARQGGLKKENKD